MTLWIIWSILTCLLYNWLVEMGINLEQAISSCTSLWIAQQTNSYGWSTSAAMLSWPFCLLSMGDSALFPYLHAPQASVRSISELAMWNLPCSSDKLLLGSSASVSCWVPIWENPSPGTKRNPEPPTCGSKETAWTASGTLTPKPWGSGERGTGSYSSSLGFGKKRGSLAQRLCLLS